MVMTTDDQGEVCDAYVPPHLFDEKHLRNVIGAPVDQDQGRKHDPLCRQRYQQWENYSGYCPDCDLIGKVRKQEQQMKEYIASTSKEVGYLAGRREATEDVMNVPTKGGDGKWILRSKAIDAARGTDKNY